MASRRRVLSRFGIPVALIAGQAACAGETDARSPLFTGTVLDAATNLPVANAVVAIEEGEGAPDAGETGAFAFGAIAGYDGVFKLSLPPGSKTLHVFADGYRRALATIHVDADLAHTFSVEANPKGVESPTLGGASFDVGTAKAGSAVRLSVDVSAPGAPLARETVVVLPDLAWSALLDPAAGAGGADTFSRTFTAPSAPGAYTYWIAAASIDGVTSDALTIVLPVE